MKLTACYAARNEEEFLPLSLQSVVPWVDELVVLDTGSTDKTKEIAYQFGAKYQYTGDTFLSVGKDEIFRRMLAMCTGDWILQLDADAIMSNDWRAEFDQKVSDDHGWASVRLHEHVGSYEYVHRNLQQDRIAAFFRRHEGLRVKGGIDKHIHGSLTSTALPQAELKLDCAWHHYAYTKRDILTKFRNNIVRGDWTLDPKVQSQYMQLSEGDIWSRLPAVRPVPYSNREIPAVMRPLFNKTYELVLADNWKIINRITL